MNSSRLNATPDSGAPWIPPRPESIHRAGSPFQQTPHQQSPLHYQEQLPMQPQPQYQQQQRPQQQQQQYPQYQQQQQQQQQQAHASTLSVSSSSSGSGQTGTTHVAQKTPSSSLLTPSPLGPASRRKMTAGSSPLAGPSPLATAVTTRPSRIKPKADMPSTLPPESVCECFICHAVSPYSQQPPPEIPVNQRQEMSRLAPTCPSIHLFCLASRIPMSLPLDSNQKSPLTRSILDYFYSTWVTDEKDTRIPRVQCLNFIPIHPITASCFDRYLEGQSWSKRVCRPLWHAADLRCKLGLEGMYRNCMQDKCASCFIFNDGFEDSIAKNKYVYLSPHSSRAHDQLVAARSTAAGGNKSDVEQEVDNKVQCMILTFAALGRAYEVPPSSEKMKRPPKGYDVVRRQFEMRGDNGSGNIGGSGSGSSSRSDSSDGPGTNSGEEYGVFAADAVVPLVMVLYKVV